MLSMCSSESPFKCVAQVRANSFIPLGSGKSFFRLVLMMSFCLLKLIEIELFFEFFIKMFKIVFSLLIFINFFAR